MAKAKTQTKKVAATKAAAKKKAIAKTVAKQAAKRAQAHPVRAEITVHVDTSPQIATETQLAEPMKDGKNMTLQPTWIGENQLLKMLQRTPREQVFKRKGKGQAEFDYVTGTYCIKWLNFVFGWNWDWEITQHGKEGGQVWAMGRLVVRGNKPGQVITKTAFGRADVKTKRDGGGNLDYGNDLKAASTDAMKKAASLLGFASDVYGKSDYKAETGYTALPAAAPARQPQEEPVIQVDGPVCTESMQNGAMHGVKITKQQADDSIKLTGAELCKIHLNARLDR